MDCIPTKKLFQQFIINNALEQQSNKERDDFEDILLASFNANPCRKLSLEDSMRSLKACESRDPSSWKELAHWHYIIGILYTNVGYDQWTFDHYRKALDLHEKE